MALISTKFRVHSPLSSKSVTERPSHDESKKLAKKWAQPLSSCVVVSAQPVRTAVTEEPAARYSKPLEQRSPMMCLIRECVDDVG